MAGGVVSGVLKGVLSSLSSPVLNEFWLVWGVEEDREKLQSNLSAIDAVLQDAERRQVNEMAVKDWLRKIKAAAHDAEDVLDEFRIEALRRKVENQEADCCGIPLEKVSNLINLPVFRFKMAHKMQKLRKNFEHIAKERDLFRFKEVLVDSQPPISSARETCSEIASEVCGRDTEKANLIDLLIKSENEKELSVIPIVGMGGVGKTTLAQFVYNDEQVVNHFKELRMWVYVSENFHVRKLLKEILESAIDGPTEQLSMELLKNRLQKELRGKRYLLVLDDVWIDNASEWDRLIALLTCGANGSKLLVTTRHDAVEKIRHAVPRSRLGTLSNEESWNLFQKLANPPQECVEIGHAMVKKCDGLPLAIRTLGDLMSLIKTVDEWEYVRTSVVWNSQDNGGRILPTLQLSYDHLTSSLKQCFAYCAIIPKGCLFVKHKLIKQWIALGFIHSDEETELLEEKAEGYFNQLLQRSLFQGPYFNYPEKEFYKMHDLIHDLVRSVGEKECCIVKASTDTVPKETRHLTVQGGKWARKPENLEALKKCEKLRSMSFYEGHLVDINACLSLTWLRVLDLNHTDISYLPNSIDKLKHLRYLDVSGTSITELPETICNLHSLQTLMIRETRIRMLPKNMKRMISLRHIEFDRFRTHIRSSPKGIGGLTCLRTLPAFFVGEESRAGIEELEGLNQLRGDFCIRRLNHVRNGECARKATLEAKKHLHSLELSWDDTAADTEGNSEEVIEKLEPQSRLKKLAVEKYMGMKFPNWMMELTNLTDIKLWDCVRCEHLPPLWQLPFLESLELRGMSAVKYIVEFDGSNNSKYIFPCLKHLELDKMLGLEGWSSQQEDGDGDEPGRERDEQVILQGLLSLGINGCPNLTRMAGLRHVSSLISLKINEVGLDMIEIPPSQSLVDLCLSCMPNLKRLSVQEAGDMIFNSLRRLDIKDCPKLICLPQLFLQAQKMLQMWVVSRDEIEFPPSHSLQHVLFNAPNLELLSLGASYDNGDVVLCPIREFSVHVNGCSYVIIIEGFPEELVPYHNRRHELKITNCSKLTSNHTGVHSLEIIDCPKLTSLSNQLENLLALKKLGIHGCNDLVLQWRGAVIENLALKKLCIHGCNDRLVLKWRGAVIDISSS